MPAASVAFFRPEFDDFLYAAVGADRNEMPLSVLSALARLDVDPWKEASELSELPKATARLRLTSLIERLPGGRWAPADCGAIADRLIELLPRRGSFKTASAQESHDHARTTHSAATKVLICAALVFTALYLAASIEPSARNDQADMPALSTRLPAQAQ